MASNSLRSKLLGSYAVCTALLLGVGAIGFYGVRSSSDNYAHIANVNLPNTLFLTRMRTGRLDMNVAVALQYAVHATAAELAKSKEMTDSGVKKFDTAAKGYEELPWAAGEEAIWHEVKKSWEPLKALTYKISALTASGNKADEKMRDDLINKDYEILNKSLYKGLTELTDLQAKETAAWVSKATAAANLANTLSLIAVLAGSAIAMLFGI